MTIHIDAKPACHTFTYFVGQHIAAIGIAPVAQRIKPLQWYLFMRVIFRPMLIGILLYKFLIRYYFTRTWIAFRQMLNAQRFRIFTNICSPLSTTINGIEDSSPLRKQIQTVSNFQKIHKKVSRGSSLHSKVISSLEL